MKRSFPVDVLLWSVALPGFGQLLNRKYFKGFLLIVLEFLINQCSQLNSVILDSFYGEIEQAIDHTNYQWLMFYPCIYMFSIWDAYQDAVVSQGEEMDGFTCLPFVFAAFIGTIGVIYSPSWRMFGIRFGPVWLPMMMLLVGTAVGSMVLYIARKYSRR